MSVALRTRHRARVGLLSHVPDATKARPWHFDILAIGLLRAGWARTARRPNEAILAERGPQLLLVVVAEKALHEVLAALLGVLLDAGLLHGKGRVVG